MKSTTDHPRFRIVMVIVLMSLRVVSAILAVSGGVLMFASTNEELTTAGVGIYAITGSILLLQWIILHDRFPAWIKYWHHSKRYWERKQYPMADRIERELRERKKAETVVMDASWIKPDELPVAPEQFQLHT